jgi:segregation and condensation protein B
MRRMTQPSEPKTTAANTEQATELGRSYAELLGHQSWEVDEAGPIEPLPPTGPSPPAAVVPPPPKRIIEAILFVGGPPLTAVRAAETIRGFTPAQFQEAIDTLNEEYRTQGRPYRIQAESQGYVLTLRPRYRPVVEKLYGSVREARLSPPAVDVLALVAYRQPVTKQEIDSLRGVESGPLLRQLIRRNLIAIVHRAEAGQREVSYGTTQRFLELFNLNSLDDLPRTEDLQIL